MSPSPVKGTATTTKRMNEVARQPSRGQRWMNAVSEARAALEAVQDAKGNFEDAMAELAEVQSEYQEWYDNMPEGLQDGATGEKLQAIIELDVEDVAGNIDVDTAAETLDSAEELELPLGFGRD